MDRRSVTSHDVARLAGVSQSTVSRALRGSSGVRSDVRERVERAAAQLGYVPSTLARSLVSRRTGAIGVLVADVTNPFYPHLLQAVDQELSAASYRMVLIVDPLDTPGDIEDYRHLLDDSLDGVLITTAALGSTTPLQLAKQGLPVVLAVRALDCGDLDTIVSDNVRGARDAAELVLRYGHTRIALILGPDSTSTSAERERGYRQALDAAQVPVPPLLRRTGTYSYETGYRHSIELLSLSEPPTALLCANDVLAIGAIEGARRLRLSVPDAVSVVGFDDMPMAGWESFKLTTVHQDIGGIARAATRRLLERIRSGAALPGRTEVFPARVVERATVGSPREASMQPRSSS